MSVGAIVGLIVIGFVLAFIEIFVPGGLLGSLGAMLVIAGVFGAGLTYGATAGLMTGLGCFVGGLLFFILWIRYFPTSRFGSILNLDTVIGKNSGYVSQDLELSRIVGSKGIAVTDLRPSGTIEIEDERFDVVTDGGFVEKGENVVVTGVDSNRIVVIHEERGQVGSS